VAHSKPVASLSQGGALMRLNFWKLETTATLLMAFLLIASISHAYGINSIQAPANSQWQAWLLGLRPLLFWRFA
jgi:hypothetical protein